MAITQTYNLDIVPKGVPEIVHCSQYDKQSRLIEFNILKAGEAYTIPSGSAVTVRGTKKDHTGFEYTCSYSGSKITVVIEEQMTVFAGDVACELRITQGSDQILGTANGILRVEPTPLGDDTVISETQLPLLEEAIEAASTVDDTVERVSSIVPSNTGTDGQVLTKSGTGAVWEDGGKINRTREFTISSTTAVTYTAPSGKTYARRYSATGLSGVTANTIAKVLSCTDDSVSNIVCETRASGMYIYFQVTPATTTKVVVEFTESEAL